MPFSESQGLVYFCFETFNDAGVLHAIFTRHGGCSNGPFRSLNTGGTVGDDSATVWENHLRIFRAINRPFESRFDVWQVHGNEIVTTDRPRAQNEAHTKADGIITDHPEVTLLMRFADCVPVLLYDRVKSIAAIVHAGWQGTMLRVAEKAVLAMVKEFGSEPQDIIAGIGPSIGPDVYEIGDEVIQQTKKAFPTVWRELLFTRNGKTTLNLWLANEFSLTGCGIRSIEHANISTYENTQDWYSHRGENGKTGRFAAIIAANQAGSK
jgi:polyphenol oxidase